MIETATFVCSICGESSADICIYCTKDTCANHRCVRCRRCSDCCECEVPLTAAEPQATDIPQGQAWETSTPSDIRHEPANQEAAAAAVEPSPPPPPLTQPEPEPPSEPLPEVEPSPASTDETVPEASPEPATQEELVKSLPELFAPDTPPPAPHEPPEEAHADHNELEEPD